MKQIGTQNTVTINTSNIVSISKIIYGDWITGFSFSYAEPNPPYPCCAFCVYLILQLLVSSMSLRRFLVASSLILSPVAAISLQSAAFAQTATDTIQIGGSVPATVSITSTTTTVATNLPLSTAGVENNLKIADLVVTTNFGAATITATSTNNGTLLNTSNPSASRQYELDIVGDGGQANNFSNLSSFTRVVEGDLDLYIQFTNPSTPQKGNYTDTIILTVSDE
ncbi:hypothetical protein [Planktothrix pseudagardhii]|uniref:Spore coat protein U domain-containing protein n=1 Tax=Planktothrix pseudagardhii TaxID=132604 RepID=A0A9W4GAA8_9CYAN|nr:hypothetical protein [Planktothrix pseudagardhii]CAD5980922.1 hypothetical protein NO713_04739 [Planktothrix pseudagardhii]